uniref:Protein kinase domain-containing protein n=1 Tax=Elaeophora elaphi TaxID=1147741 RepID=A0A0R3S362_9BILA
MSKKRKKIALPTAEAKFVKLNNEKGKVVSGENLDDVNKDEEDEKHHEEPEEQSGEQLHHKKMFEMKKKEEERRKSEQRKSPKERSKLANGVIINTDRSRYEIIEILGAGGFGDVYKVRQIDSNEVFALKTEKNTTGKALNRLKVITPEDLKHFFCEQMEMTIFQECESLPEEKRKHFVKMADRGEMHCNKAWDNCASNTFEGNILWCIGRITGNITTTLMKCLYANHSRNIFFRFLLPPGRTESFKFIVMQLVGAGVDELQKKQPKRHFTLSTTIKLGLQTLEGIADLHDLGYLHRDIKPQNFSIGLKEKANVIYVLDFGIARRYIEKDSKAIRLPRKMVRFLGTVRFASRSCHRSREQCRRDDLESWMYMLIEFTEYASLPWSRISDREIVCKEKERLFAGLCLFILTEYFEELDTKHIASLPEEIHKILKYINELDFENTPDYEYIAMMLKRAAARKHASITVKFDWEQSESGTCRDKKMSGSDEKCKIPSEKSEDHNKPIKEKG